MPKFLVLLLLSKTITISLNILFGFRKMQLMWLKKENKPQIISCRAPLLLMQHFLYWSVQMYWKPSGTVLQCSPRSKIQFLAMMECPKVFFFFFFFFWENIIPECVIEVHVNVFSSTYFKYISPHWCILLLCDSISGFSFHSRPIHRQMQSSCTGSATSKRGCHIGESCMCCSYECRRRYKSQGVKGCDPSYTDHRC